MPKAVFPELNEDDTLDAEAVGAQEDPPGRRPLPWLRVLLLLGVMTAGLAQLAQRAFRDETTDRPVRVADAALVAPDPVWVPIVRSSPVYGIDNSPLPVAAEARRHRSGLQDDTLIIGTFGEAGSGRISFAMGLPDPPAGSLFVETVRRAADAGLSVLRNAPSRMLATRFGPVETAAMTLAGAGEQSCQAFRFRDSATDFGFHGWLCGSATNPVDDSALACLMDRVVLVGSDDLSLKALFAQADEQRLAACPALARTASIVLNTRGGP